MANITDDENKNTALKADALDALAERITTRLEQPRTLVGLGVPACRVDADLADAEWDDDNELTRVLPRKPSSPRASKPRVASQPTHQSVPALAEPALQTSSTQSAPEPEAEASLALADVEVGPVSSILDSSSRPVRDAVGANVSSGDASSSVPSVSSADTSVGASPSEPELGSLAVAAEAVPTAAGLEPRAEFQAPAALRAWSELADSGADGEPPPSSPSPFDSWMLPAPPSVRTALEVSNEPPPGAWQEAQPNATPEETPLAEVPRASSPTLTPPPNPGEPSVDLSALLESARSESPPARVLEAYSERSAALEPTQVALRSDAPWTTSAADSKRSWRRSRPRLAAAGFAATLLLAVAAVGWLLVPQKGNLVIAASGPNQSTLEDASVLVDGKLVCAAVPCRVPGVAPGLHSVRVRAKGHDQADHPLVLKAGSEAALQLVLARSANSGLRIQAEASGLTIRLDGEGRGATPAVIRGLSAGEHLLELGGSPLFAPYSQRVKLEPDQVLELTPRLTRIRGVLELRAAAQVEGAEAEIWRSGVSGSASVSPLRITTLPAHVELEVPGSYHVRALRPGYEEFAAEVTFAANDAQKTVNVDFARKNEPTPQADGAQSVPGVSGSSALGTLSVNSIPISSVLVDGRPAGTTPRKLSLPAGVHALAFVHPALGKREVTVNVPAHAGTVAAVKF